MIEKTIDYDKKEIQVGDKIEVLKFLGNLWLGGIQGEITRIKHGHNDEGSWTLVYLNDCGGTSCGVHNYNVRKI